MLPGNIHDVDFKVAFKIGHESDSGAIRGPHGLIVSCGVVGQLRHAVLVHHVDSSVVAPELERDPAEGDAASYRFKLVKQSMFSAVLVWYSQGDDAWVSCLPDYELAVYDGRGVGDSNGDTSNAELVETLLQPGSYDMKVRVASDAGRSDYLNNGLAQTTKPICSLPGGLRIGGDAGSWTIEWDPHGDTRCHMYRLQMRTAALGAPEELRLPP